MKEEINNKINERLKSLREIADVSYAKPENRNEEYDKRLFKNMEAINYLQYDRKIDYNTIKHFNLGLSEYGELAIPIYKNGELINYKFRTLPPKKKDFKHVKGSEMWIFNDVGIEEGKKIGEICITEGEIDAISVYQAGFKNVISVTNGTQSTGLWIEKLDEIKKIFINFDNDEAGKAGALKLAERLGIEKCINVVTPSPYKDANDFFLKESPQAYKNLLSNSKKFPIEDVVTLSDFYDEVRQNKTGKKDFEFPYNNLNKVTGGFNRSNLMVVSGETGHGKSTWLINVLVKLAQKGIPVLYMPLEDNPRYIARRIFNILSGMEVSRLDEHNWESLKNIIRDFPFYMYIGQEKLDINIFSQIVERGKKLYNIEIFALDHIHFLAKRVRDMTEEIGYIMRELVEICRKYNISIFNIAHIRKKLGGERKDMPNIDDLKDSSALKQDAHMVLMIFQRYLEFENLTMVDVAIQKNREGNTTPYDKDLLYKFDR